MAAAPVERSLTSPDPLWRRPVLQFIAAGLVAVVVLLAVSGWFARRAALQQAIGEAELATELLAGSVVEPGIPHGLVDRQSAAVDRFDRLIRHRVLGGWLMRVKMWDADGRIVYSDEVRLIGERFALGADEQKVLREGGVDAELSELSGPENRFERGHGRLVEVYTQVRAPDGQPMLFETYYGYQDVAERSSAVLAAFRPITVAGLLLFQALTIPLVLGLTRRLRRAREERERLLVRAVEASDRERRRIARDLHDGVVQELAGTSFALSAVADDLRRASPHAATLSRVADGVRQSIRSLRSLLVEIYPPNLHTEGLDAALADLLAPLPGSGLTTSLAVPEGLRLPPADAELVWRVAQESVRNAQRHAGATHLAVRVTQETDTVALEVVDDGQGFPSSGPRTDGHFGIRLLHDLAADAGARLDVESRPGEGTTVRLKVPRR